MTERWYAKPDVFPYSGARTAMPQHGRGRQAARQEPRGEGVADSTGIPRPPDGEC